ncbi:secretion/conjugation apparatus DotM-related subunit [Pseudomonas aeruginosa]
MILIILVLCVIGALFYYFFWVYAGFWKWLRIFEIGMIATLLPDVVERMIGVDFEGGLKFLLETPYELLTAEMIGQFDGIYLKYFYWIPGAIFAFTGFVMLNKNDGITQIYNMENILSRMAPAFPNVKGFMGIHPEKMPLDFYPDDPSSYEFSLAMGDRQFAQCFPPVGLEKAAEKDESLNRPIWDGGKKFDEVLARKSFDSQLGPLYMGYNRLSEDEKKLTDMFIQRILVKRADVLNQITDYMKQAYAIAKAKAEGKKPPSETIKLLEDKVSHRSLADRLAAYVDQEIQANPNWRPTDAACRKISIAPEFKSVLQQVVADKCISKHAYVRTGLMSLLEVAREGKTLPPSELRWLKGRNRPLWYAIDSPGRKTPFAEAAGTYAHWLLEKKAEIAIPYPETTEAIEALKQALGLNDRPAGGTVTADDWG